MGRWGAVARPGGRKCTHAPRQRIKCSLAGISAPLSPQPCCLASSREALARRTRRASAGSSRGPSSLPWTPGPLCPGLSVTRSGPGAGVGGGGGPWLPGCGMEACGEHCHWGGGHSEGSKAVHGPGAGDSGCDKGGGPTGDDRPAPHDTLRGRGTPHPRTDRPMHARAAHPLALPSCPLHTHGS